jgi:hypothetical protein
MQGPPKCTQIGIFVLKINHLATLGTTLDGRFVLVQIKAKSGTKAITLGMRLFTWTSLVMSFQKGLKLCSASISFS